MAENPNRPGPPDPSDDDLSPGAFDGLGLGSLAEDVRPSRAQWSAMVTASERRGRARRPWLISTAAAVVLIVAVTGLFLARSGREDPDVVAGFGSTSAPWALPPQGAEVTAIVDASDQWVLQFVVDGQAYTLNQRIDVVGVTGPTTVAEAIESMMGTVLGTRVTVPGIGSAHLMCSGLQTTQSDDGTTGYVPTGPSALAWSAPGWAYYVTGVPSSVEPGGCGAEDPDPSALLDLAAGMRFVDAAGKQTFLDEHSDVVQDPQGGGVVAPATTSTTIPEDPPADRPSAEEQIRTAVEDWKAQDADGSFIHLEAGTEKAAEYAELFDTAAEQSGAAQAGDGSENRNEVITIRFVTPERAAVTMSLTAKLPTGTYTFTQEGEVILEDGRWVVTYRTVTTTLGRACTPPGGYDGCPTN